MKISVKGCDDCPMLEEVHGCLFCNHPGGPIGIGNEPIHPKCPLLIEDTIISLKSDVETMEE